MTTFSEIEDDTHCLHFEKISCSLKWPKDSCTLLLQSTLVGKAREAYTALMIEESSQYNAVLKAYELDHTGKDFVREVIKTLLSSHEKKRGCLIDDVHTKKLTMILKSSDSYC